MTETETNGCGIAGAWASRVTIPPTVWQETIAGANDDVCLLGTALGGYSNDEVMLDLTRDKLAAGCRFRLVLQSPYSDAANVMAMQKNEPIDDKITASLERLAKFRAGLRVDDSARFEVATYPSWMGFAMFRGDNRALVTAILPWVIVDVSPTLDLVKGENGIFDSYVRSFEGIWKHADRWA